MVGDLFHIGHIRLIQHVQQRGYSVVVGVHSDEDVAQYKRTPIMTLNERATVVRECKYVSDVIMNAPLKITEEFLTAHRIDMVFHGHAPEEDHFYGDMYDVPMKLSKFTRTERTPSISTSALIERVLAREQGSSWMRVSSLHDIPLFDSSKIKRLHHNYNNYPGRSRTSPK